MLLQAFIVAFVVFITVGGQELLGFTMLGRPIVIGPLLGLLLGDLQTGLLIGASLETIFMGVVNIGGASSAEPGLATALATAFAINMEAGVDIVLPIAIPLGIIGLQIKTLIYVGIVGPFATKFDELAEQGEAKKIAYLHYGLWLLQWFIYSLIPFFAILYGAELTQNALEQIPDVIVHGLSIAGNLLPAVGMAMLLKILWDKHLFIYFLLGFVLISYFKIPLIAVAVIAAIIAVIVSHNDLKFKRMNDKNQAVSSVNTHSTDQELDQFFN
ncbi:MULTISPECIES: PTS sugar transporter subunit IIC [Aerococcus]|uniref:PTS sugar transporter subunit IIC n=1 Tax=Aerococcus mictus TaxID=2976810 RepID=A0A1E9P997_9LACT|nr:MULTISPECIES: PTS sugar transporter subunit IIC [Aerococcus]KAA9234466.1 PTS sugar transporter subunit IIC [Aerococcus mictus]KAA9291511.1 PTS sugar transporter subunit IIC [Aerococcus mictus]MBU5610200.1 PTS sugar transporter subunit IIC [Aerococcus urinae]MCY3034810.1 PTS sugar transporter subunit IIC [Aerococcus mictus]MCY3064144.1 PTS sugar transporter subunit IIC [Aerococcus mictus]